MKDKLLALLVKYVDVRGMLVEGVIKGLVEPAIDKVVADSTNKYDDALKPVIMPAVEQIAVSKIDEFLAKFLPAKSA